MTSMSSPGDLFRFRSLALSGGYCRENSDIQTMFYSNTSLGGGIMFFDNKVESHSLVIGASGKGKSVFLSVDNKVRKSTIKIRTMTIKCETFRCFLS